MNSDDGEILPGLEESYDHIRKVAVGGMAEVYLGRQKSLGRPVAIKRIRPEFRTNKDLLERFRREAKISGELLHQNLGHVYDYRSVGSEAYIVMEYIDGFDLAEILERVKSLPIDVALMVALRILWGLEYVHSHGMVHRDLKPDNVRISTRGEVKIMDFGITLDPSEANLTMPGVLIGSPHYLSPEQVTGDRLDGRADLFSFGITLYEMVTGKKPFFETQTESVYSRIKKGDFIPPQNIRPEIPPFITHLIQSCLQVSPARRPESAQVLAEMIADYLVQNHSLSLDARTRQFLMQSRIMPGDPGAIEVGEKTPPPISGFMLFSKAGAFVDRILGKIFKSPTHFFVTLFVVLGFLALGGMWILQGKGTVSSVIPLSRSSSAPRQ
jgi:serine/threonine-protein kinase